MDRLEQALGKAGNPVHRHVFSGGHDMADEMLLAPAVGGLDDIAPERRDQRLRKAIEETPEGEAERPIDAYFILRDALAGHAGRNPLAKEAQEVLGKLARIPEVRSEILALERYERALAWIEKAGDRIGKHDSVRQQAVAKLRAVAKGHEGTRAATWAEEKIADLGERDPRDRARTGAPKSAGDG